MDGLYLVFVNEICVTGGVHEYEFYFAKNPDAFWGVGFDADFANKDEVIPDKKTYDEVIRLKSTIPFFCAQNNKCFSMQHVVDGVIAVAFEDIIDYDEYPEPYRIVFQYGESYTSVEEKLAGREQKFED